MTSHRDPAPGALVDNRYRLVAPLGEGTFGAVWRAQDTRLSGRSVAVKFLKPEFLAHPEAVTRFEAEADALAQVQHPNVVGVHDRGQWGDTHYLVTEFVEGRPLTAWIEDHRARRAYADVGTALVLFDQICAGLEAAHAVRAPGPIVHRDLKPENILVRVQANGEPLVKILDFGIAQLGGRTGTRTGALMGTPLYMAPEQALGNTAAIAPSTDVFALGVVLAEMLTLRAQVDVTEPWWGTTMQRGPEVRGLLAAMRADVPPALWDVIAKALSSRGIDRYSNAGALRVALRGVNSQASTAVAMASTQLAPRVQTPVRLPATVVGGPPPAVDRTVLSVPPAIANSSTAPIIRDAVRPPARPAGLLVAVVAGIAVVGIGVGFAVHHRSDGTTTPPAAILATSQPRSNPDPRVPNSTVVIPPVVIPRPAVTASDGPSVGADAALSAFNAPAVPASPAPAPARVAASPAPAMVLIPRGTFTMGSGANAHSVTLEPFSIDRTEVTVAAYAQCVGASVCVAAYPTIRWSGATQETHRVLDPTCNQNRPDRQQHPVNCVDWTQANVYCHWVGGGGGRLPSEAEWEYAARGSDGRTYPWGNEAPSPVLLNACGSECVAWWGSLGVTSRSIYDGSDEWANTAPVGSHPAGRSPFGLDDMAGNVSEWTADVFGLHGVGGPSVSNRQRRVFRGGGWNEDRASWLAAYVREGHVAWDRNSILGFRCAR